MYEAMLNGTCISAREFHRKYPNYKKISIYANCIVCNGELIISAASSIKRGIHFKHRAGAKCTRSLKLFERYSNPRKTDPKYGKKLKEEFHQEDNIRIAFKTMKNIVGHPMTGEVFLEICGEADRQKIWNYVGLTLEYLPYIMLTKHLFKPKKDNYAFHYVLDKPNRTKLDVIWEQPGKFALEKTFAQSGKPMSEGHNYLTAIPDQLKHPPTTPKIGNEDDEINKKDYEFIKRTIS